ncbi:MAG: MATE family efflux transporter [Gammaproteobacteria bacterium]|nr:MATE family efflux transporter [Gammaproteobacteria bacterium]MBU2059001.1 MATE family efflux transporter [Gammaproteobacteria bacterium]MBU2174764.1 MATE family efflux transporter [Gammaproteobacteria bacterium]MBU2245789.1 MATE family efflux transporter [Gammaproteobacteria bacterium]MBU2343569.1 MATE family efflux transporter [Gammaproteobacteria bacterium]
MMKSRHSNPALEGPVLRTFFYYVLPSMIGLVALTTANLVDGIFVGHQVGAGALAAISLLLPYFSLLIAISLMLAIGGAVTVGKYLGQNDSAMASALFSKVMMLTLLLNSLFAIGSYLAEPWLLWLLKAPLEVQPLMQEYLAVIRWVFIGQLSTMVLYYFVRMDGHPVLGTLALLTGALANILFDALFIVHLQMGLAGAAYGTAIAQLLQCAVLSTWFFSQGRRLRFSWYQQNWRLLWRTAYNGFSELINELSVGLLFLLLNWLLVMQLGTEGVAAFSVVNYLMFLSVMLSYGVADALHLLVSQNYGAGKRHRISQFLNLSLLAVCTLGSVLAVALVFAQSTVVNWFLDAGAETVAKLSGDIMLLIWPLFLVNGCNILLSCYLTAVHQPAVSATLASCRSIVLPGAMLLLFYGLFYHSSVFDPAPADWLFLIGLPVAEWLSFLLAMAYAWRFRPARLL